MSAIHVLPVAASSQDILRELAADGAASGTAVIVKRQTAGRGRRGRKWESPPGDNVSLSVLHRPALDVSALSAVTLDIAVAVADVLEREGVRPRLKWPNDILLGGRKVGGILCELHTDGGAPALIVGLGLNVNVPRGGFSAALTFTATSLNAASGRTHDAEALAKAFVVAIRHACAAYDRRGGPDIPAYRQRLATAGQRVMVQGRGEGRAVGIGDDGALLVVFEGSDEVEPVRAGIVEHLADAEPLGAS